jgi:hypothetical protein
MMAFHIPLGHKCIHPYIDSVLGTVRCTHSDMKNISQTEKYPEKQAYTADIIP